jgi:hypothetical protein
MKRFAIVVVLLFVTAAVMGVSLFKCKPVHSYAEMADIRLGWPVPFLSVNMQRYTPLVFPQYFRVGSPWEDPIQVLWPSVAVNIVLIFGSLFGLNSLALRLERKEHV